MTIFPFGFQGRVVIENPASEILLRDQFRFRFEMSPSGGDFLVKRNADWIDHWVRQVVDRLNRAAVVMKTIIAAVRPIERINPELDPIGDSDFELFADENIVPVRTVPPRYRVFEFDAARRRSRLFVEKSEMANAGERA